MSQPFTKNGVILLAALCSSCAASYTPLHPERIRSYSTSLRREAVDLSYDVDALRAGGGNKRYAKKEAKARYNVTALRVTNNTDRELSFGRDLVLLSGSQVVAPINPVVAAADMKQGVAIYLLYLLLNFNIGGTTITNPNTGQTATSGGTFIPTGPFIAAGNMIGAGTANGNFRKDLQLNDLNNRIIKPGATVYGVVTLRSSEASSLHVLVRDDYPQATGGQVSTPAPAEALPAPVAPPQPPAASPVPADPAR